MVVKDTERAVLDQDILDLAIVSPIGMPGTDE
jgi:hypothetical protein